VDGNRRYADEPDPTWYPAPGNPYESPEQERPSGAFRLPDQRYPDQRPAPADPYALPYAPPEPYPTPDPLISAASQTVAPPEPPPLRIPVRGPEYPTIRPTSAPGAESPANTYGTPAPTDPAANPTTYGQPAEPAATDPTAFVPAVPQFAPAPAKTRRPIGPLIVAGVAALLMIPVVILLIRVTFIDHASVRGIVPAVLLALGLPLTGVGLYTLAAGHGPAGRDGWLRPPIAYLPVGLLLLVAAALAVA
jgi:hypothetical protein